MDADRFRAHLATEAEVAVAVRREIGALTALLEGRSPQLETVPDLPGEQEPGESTASEPEETRAADDEPDVVAEDGGGHDA